MDHIEKRRRRSDFAYEPEIADWDERPGTADEELSSGAGGAPRRSDVTGRPDQGGDEETDDGLNATDEALRRAAEDEPSGRDGERLPDRLPVFDRGDTVPKI